MAVPIHKSWMALIVLILVSAAVPMVSATGEVTWHLRNDVAAGFDYPAGHEYDRNMTKESPTSTRATWFKIGPENESWWYANHPTECNLTFPAGEWNVTFSTQLDTTIDKGKHVEIRLWRLFENGTAADFVAESGLIDIKGVRLHTVLLQADAIDIDKGDRIAISFKWASDASEQVWMGCNGVARDSTLTSPPNSPAYPIPEPLTIVLISTGLLMLAGYAYMGRRNR